jgi:hypothetical protein
MSILDKDRTNAQLDLLEMTNQRHDTIVEAVSIEQLEFLGPPNAENDICMLFID